MTSDGRAAIVLVALASGVSGFTPPGRSSAGLPRRTAVPRAIDDAGATPLEEASAAVITAARAFGADEASFAEVWVNKALKGELAEAGLMEKCLTEPDCAECVALEEAMQQARENQPAGLGPSGPAHPRALVRVQMNRLLGRYDGLNS